MQFFVASSLTSTDSFHEHTAGSIQKPASLVTRRPMTYLSSSQPALKESRLHFICEALSRLNTSGQRSRLNCSPHNARANVTARDKHRRSWSIARQSLLFVSQLSSSANERPVHPCRSFALTKRPGNTKASAWEKEPVKKHRSPRVLANLPKKISSGHYRSILIRRRCNRFRIIQFGLARAREAVKSPFEPSNRSSEFHSMVLGAAFPARSRDRCLLLLRIKRNPTGPSVSRMRDGDDFVAVPKGKIHPTFPPGWSRWRCNVSRYVPFHGVPSTKKDLLVSFASAFVKLLDYCAYTVPRGTNVYFVMYIRILLSSYFFPHN